MDESSVKRRTRPAQRLYVPPAQRNKQSPNVKPSDIPMQTPETEIPKKIEVASNEPVVILEEVKNSMKYMELVDTDKNTELSTKENKLVIMLKERTGPDINGDTVKVNRKCRPIIKHVQNDVLNIDVKKPSNKSNKKSPVKLMQVANWEDLFLDDDQEDNYDDQISFTNNVHDDGEDDDVIINPKMQELEHVIELYDFPSTFRTPDIMQIYSDINKESMFIKWCDETHALLILGSSIQAQRALNLQHDIIKSRPMTMAGQKALEVAAKSDLRPAMKRPQTSMHAARRMITTALGARNTISREEQQKEREALKRAKELKRTQRQNERDAWEGNPRPSTA
ncbi:PREDICTED: coiled-coil domain-containing protein R3HCC1L [Nicrophorus vespilloides]|uniref:Coiled-coil domain-containing protein R3HCC1L n=1 Tax=Nicrophorus vespilloides TaxID=110193 RepID=A0ABM1NK92_NICVS|nr:PREDICTED: coiled-coil domain-containing protein R3HCC1L [Nicrophorus vespilloides]